MKTTYFATVLGNALQVSKQKATPSIKIKCQTMYDVTNPSLPVSKILYGDLWLTYKTMENTLKVLKNVFNWKGMYITDFEKSILTGVKVQIVCESEEYDGKIHEKIQFFNKPGGLSSVEGEELKTLIDDVQPMLNDVFKSEGIIVPKIDISSSDNNEVEGDISSFNESDVTDIADDDLPF